VLTHGQLGTIEEAAAPPAAPSNHIKWRFDMACKSIPQALCDSLSYDPNTGEFVWAVRSSRRTRAGDKAGSVWKNGRTYISWKGSSYQAHRVAWKIHYGEDPGPLIDHRDQNPANNAISNLRNATRSVNAMNKPAKGVYKDGKMWRAMIRINGKLISLYCGPDHNEAVKARQKAVDEFWSQHS